jgi:hypothetical protein
MSEYDDPELAAAAAAAARSRRSDKRWKSLLALLSLLLAAVTIVAFYLAMNNGRLASENAEFAAAQQGEKKEIAREAGQALCGKGEMEIYDQQLCEKWADAAQEPVVTPSSPPAVVDNGPTQAELVQAFREYCDNGNCRGRDGAEPTPDDIAAAFATFCADGRCTGPAGAAGKNGTDGADATAPTPEMMLAAVTTYCADGRCVGPKGSDGKDGADGAPATTEAILAAVQQYCSNDACRGPAGADGSTGATGPAPASIRIRDAAGRHQTCVPDPPGSTDYSCTYDDGLGNIP